MQSFRAKKAIERVIEFELAEDIYYFKSGKASEAYLAMLLAPGGDLQGLNITKSQFNWLADGLDPNHNDSHKVGVWVDNCQACRLERRLRDTKDKEVDFDLVQELIQWLLGQVAARPTGSPST